MRHLEAEIAALQEQRSALPRPVSLRRAGRREVMRMEQKATIGRIKLTAYSAEEWLLRRLAVPNPNDRTAGFFAEFSGVIRSTAQDVVITPDAPDTPLHSEAPRLGSTDLGGLRATFPGADLLATYQVAVHHSELVVCPPMPNPPDSGLCAVGVGAVVGGEVVALYNLLCGAFRAGGALDEWSAGYSSGTLPGTGGPLARHLVLAAR